MILQVSEDVKRIGVRIKSWRNQRYTNDYEHLQLLIVPPPPHANCCHTGGSPWFVWGCWPGHRTGVDLMNPPPPDFPAFLIDAQEMKDGMVMFILPSRWHETVPFGRYEAFIQYQPELPGTIFTWTAPAEAPRNWGHLDPGCYHMPDGCDCPPRPEPHMIPPLPPRACILAKFDIDYGPRCSQHIIDKAAIELEG